MVNIKLDHTINTPTLITIISSVISIVVFIMNIKSDVKTHGVQITQLTQEVGEMRRLHMKTIALAETQDATIKKQEASIKDNSKHIKTATAKVTEVTNALKIAGVEVKSIPTESATIK